MRAKLSMVVLFISCMFSVGLANELESKMHSANLLVATEKYSEAITAYQEILATDHYSSELYYNLGICYYQQKDMGMAILNFKRALKFDPSFDAARENIETIKSEQVNTIYEVEPFFLTVFWKNLSNTFSPTVWGVISLLIFASLIYLVYLFLFNERNYPTNRLKAGMLGLVFFFVISFAAGNQRLSVLNSNKHAIVLEASSRYAGPDEKSVIDQDLIPEGTEVIILEELSGWYKVSLPDLDHVWMKPDMFELI